MSSYSSLLSPTPADWVGGCDAEAMAAVSSYLSFDADVAGEYYYCHPPEEAAFQPGLFVDALRADCVGGEATGSSGGGEASEQSPTTDASTTVLLRPAGLATSDDNIISDDRRLCMASGHDGSSRTSLPTGRRGRIAFKTRSDVDVLDDGYRWRKYGKKMVKNSPNPRNYYRCSSEGCHVKKRVEREGDDQRFVITTYEGVHNHPAMPLPHRRGPMDL